MDDGLEGIEALRLDEADLDEDNTVDDAPVLPEDIFPFDVNKLALLEPPEGVGKEEWQTKRKRELMCGFLKLKFPMTAVDTKSFLEHEDMLEILLTFITRSKTPFPIGTDKQVESTIEKRCDAPSPRPRFKRVASFSSRGSVDVQEESEKNEKLSFAAYRTLTDGKQTIQALLARNAYRVARVLLYDAFVLADSFSDVNYYHSCGVLENSLSLNPEAVLRLLVGARPTEQNFIGSLTRLSLFLDPLFELIHVAPVTSLLNSLLSLKPGEASALGYNDALNRFKKCLAEYAPLLKLARNVANPTSHADFAASSSDSLCVLVESLNTTANSEQLFKPMLSDETVVADLAKMVCDPPQTEEEAETEKNRLENDTKKNKKRFLTHRQTSRAESSLSVLHTLFKTALTPSVVLTLPGERQEDDITGAAPPPVTKTVDSQVARFSDELHAGMSDDVVKSLASCLVSKSVLLQNQGELIKHNSYSVRRPFSHRRLLLVDLVADVASYKHRLYVLNDCVDVEGWRTMVLWFSEYENNSLYLNNFTRLVGLVLRSGDEQATRTVLKSCKLLKTVVSAFKNKHASNRGHALKILSMVRLQNQAVSADSFLAQFLKSNVAYREIEQQLVKETSRWVKPEDSPLAELLPLPSNPVVSADVVDSSTFYADVCELGTPFAISMGFEGVERYEDAVESAIASTSTAATTSSNSNNKKKKKKKRKKR